MKRELSAGIGAYIGRTPRASELRKALARPGEDALPKSTHEGWVSTSALDRTSDSLLRVANYYDGQTDVDGNTIDARGMYVHLMEFFGYTLGEGAPDFPVTTKREATTRKATNFDLRTFGE
jgi:hypothetical protein